MLILIDQQVKFPHVHDTFHSPLTYRILYYMEISLKLKKTEIIQRVNNMLYFDSREQNLA